MFAVCLRSCPAMADPSSTGANPDVLESLGTVVVLLASGDDRSRAASAAIELCAEWAAAGRRVVLADLHLESPVLHDELGVDNLEGIVDIFVYGASLARIARPVRNGSFFFIPAGTYAPDAGEIYKNARWPKLLAGFRDAEAVLALFASAEDTDLRALAAWSNDLILLGAPPPPERLAEFSSSGFRVLGSVEPLDPGVSVEVQLDDVLTEVPEAIAQEATPLGVGSDEDGEAVSAGLAVDDAGFVDDDDALAEGFVSDSTGDPDEGSSGVVGADPSQRVPATIVHRGPESDLELPPPPKRQEAEPRHISVMLWLLLGVVILAALGYLVLSLRPDLLPGGSPDRPPGEEGGRAAAGLPAVVSRAAPLPYSVPVKAFSSLAPALEEVASNQQRFQDVPFYISPESDQGILYYRVFAGTLPDTVAAGLLRERLIAEGLIDEADNVGRWSFIELTPLAFDVGEFETMAAAAARIDSLAVRSIPVYATAVPYSNGSRRWQLYGGAYRDSVAAGAMRDMLTTSGIPAHLTTRSGAFLEATPGTSR